MTTQLEISKEKFKLENQLQQLLQKRKDLERVNEEIDSVKDKLIHLQQDPEIYFQSKAIFNNILDRLNSKNND
jgi:hypothetical protein